MNPVLIVIPILTVLMFLDLGLELRPADFFSAAAFRRGRDGGLLCGQSRAASCCGVGSDLGV